MPFSWYRPPQKPGFLVSILFTLSRSEIKSCLPNRNAQKCLTRHSTEPTPVAAMSFAMGFFMSYFLWLHRLIGQSVSLSLDQNRIAMKRLPLFLQKEGETQIRIGSIILLDTQSDIVISNEDIVLGFGKHYCVALDGQQSLMREIVQARLETVGMDLAPYVFRIKLESPQ